MFAGRPLLSHQIDYALDAGAEAIICLCGGINAQIIACQHRTEDAGARFQALEDSHRIAAIVKPDDQVLVLQDGLLPGEKLTPAFDGDPTVYCLKAEPAVPLGFERIDADLAWAGVLVTRGEAVNRLTDLSADSDPASALLRIALQSGAAQRVIDIDESGARDWLTGPDQTQSAAERRWIAAKSDFAGFDKPGKAVAQRAAARLARDIIGTRFEHGPMVLGVVCGASALLAAVNGLMVVSLLLALLAALAFYGQQIVQLLSRGSRPSGRMKALLPLPSIFLDVVMAGSLVLPPALRTSWLAWFLALMLVVLRRVCARTDASAFSRTLSDRSVVIGGLLLGTLIGSPFAAAALLLLAMSANLLVQTYRASDLTDD